MVAYDGLSTLLVEKTSIEKDGERRQCMKKLYVISGMTGMTGNELAR